MSGNEASLEDEMESSLDDVKDGEAPEVPPAVVAAGVVAAVVGLGIIGWMVFRGRRRRTVVQQLQDAIPSRVRNLPVEFRTRVRRAK